VEERKKKMKNK